MRRITLSFDLDDKTAKLFLQSSLERVINTSVKLVETTDLGDTDVNLEDWREWKPVVVTFWNVAHDAIFRMQSDLAPDGRVFALKKGDI